jgi:hypothetical protein
LNAAAFWPKPRARDKATRRWANLRWNTIGASLVVSEPKAMPDSICPVAILAARPSAPCKLVPQACIMVMPGVVGARALPITASRARFQSLAWVTTAPPTTSSIWAPWSEKRSTSPPSVPISMSRLVSSA